MKTAVSIPDAVFVEADRLARRRGISRSELYVEALQRLLHDESDADVTAALDEVHDGVPSGLEEPLARAQRRALIADW